MITPEDKATPGDLKEAKEMARAVIAHHFGTRPRRVTHLPGGLSNSVFAVKLEEGQFVVRVSTDAGRINAFIKEQWAQTRAREAGVPTTEILEVGNEVIPRPYMILRAVEGQEATYHPNRLGILREMGRYAALINSIATTGFGSTFDWSNNQLSRNKSWDDYLHKELRLDARLEILSKRRILTPGQIKTLRDIFSGSRKRKHKARLSHGDIRLKNVMVGEGGEIRAILDWEHCTSNLAPEWELSLALHDLSIDEKQVFLEGYGLGEKKIKEVSPLVKAINVINYAPEIERLAEQKDLIRLEQYRTRLSGALDFYSVAKMNGSA